MLKKLFILVLIVFSINGNAQYYLDSDSDGYGNPYIMQTQPVFGFVSNSGDPNDSNPCIPSSSGCGNYHDDYDGDGFGATYTTYGRLTPANQGMNALDCYDLDANINPNTKWSLDSDGDGYGSMTNYIVQCIQPASIGSINYVPNITDCDDTNPYYNNPNALWYLDADGDGFGNPSSSILCGAIGYVSNNLDCDDTKKEINPNTKWYIDNDNDGFGENSTSTVTACIKPTGNFVANNADNCPTIAGGIFGCIVPSGNDSTYDQNYILITKPKIASTDISTITDVNNINVDVTYFDGLGRPIQNVAFAQSNSGKDIVTPIEYDFLGRQPKDYLAYSTSTTASTLYKATALADVNSYYNTTNFENTLNPYSEKQFENSPLNRVLKQAAPGNDWALGAGHEIKFDYQTNVANEVKLYTVTATWHLTYKIYWNIPLTDGGYYAANQLYKTVTKDENWLEGNGNTTIDYKDKEGRIVLKRNNVEKTNKFGSITITAHDTYYVYDQFGNLTYVIPPLVDTSIVLTTTVLSNLCYQYKYDHRNRLAEKKLPGKQWEFIVYDKLDRVVATGPAISPFTNFTTQGWLITKYDAYNRVAYTGWENLAATVSSRATKQTAQNGITTSALFESKAAPGVIDGIGAYYTNTVAPTVFKLLTVNYYDDYNFAYSPTFPVSPILGEAVFYNKTTDKPKGLQIGSWTRTLSTSTSTVGESNYILYDYKARPIRSYTRNYLGGYTQVDTKYDFVGKVITTQTTHNRTLTTPATITINDNFTYTNQDQLARHSQKINTMPEQLIAENTYDELGKLISKKVGNQIALSTPLQKIDYKYNIRGWLKGINDDTSSSLLLNTSENDLFAFKINYNTVQYVSGYTGKALFNGNISETHWRALSDNVLRKYGYNYDALNRLTNAVYQKPDNAVPVSNSYDESMGYDKNGNISYMNRYGDTDSVLPAVLIDQLTYTYDATSNKLIKVEDGTASTSGFNNYATTAIEYGYDSNGNMTRDDNKRITLITYNHLNLPTRITFGTLGNIVYTYSGTGQKLKKVVTVTTPASVTTTDYTTGFQYENTVLQFFPHAEGYVKNIAGMYSYVFNYTDHLGNTRLSYSDLNSDNAIATSEILEESHYYPFGLKHSGYNMNNAQPKYKYKYNGKELQDELGLNMYDYLFRQYMPDIARFTTIDPMADFVNYQSPYVFSDNSPVMNIDDDGLGIFNVIGNLFKRLVGAIGSIGNDCSCNKYTQESVAGAWNRADFPAVNEFINNLFSGNGKKNTVSTETSENGTRGKLEAIGMGSMGVVMNEPKIEADKVNIRTPEINPIFEGRVVTSAPIKISKTINFDFKSTKLKSNFSDKTINALIKTLIDYPQLTLTISVNVSEVNPSANWSTKANVDGKSGTLNSLQFGRAKAIMNFLIRRGVNPSQINTQRGSIQRDEELPRTTLKLINTRR